MADDREDKTYKDSLKATTLLGGVQVFNIIISIIKSKVIAVLLGPDGMGISGLLTSTTDLVKGATNFGLSTSAVRNISIANNSNDQKRIAIVISVFRRLVWVTGLLGALLCFVFASLLSKWTFDNDDYTNAFRLLSVTLLLTQLSSGQSTLMQGMQKYSYIAKSGVIGSAIGLIISIPLYYQWGIEAIVPVMIISSIVTLLLTYIYANKIKVPKELINFDDIKKEGYGMLTIGFLISLQALFSILISYIVRIFINHTGGLSEVGLYNAGFAIVNMYVGLVFTAMGTDYYPRLSAVSDDNNKLTLTMNQQIEIALLLVSPIIISFIVYIKPLIVILYSSKFVGIIGMVYWAIFGVFFKTVSWSIAFSFLSKGDSVVYFLNEVSAIIYSFVLNILFYYYWGLTGIGISFLICYIMYMVQVWIICRFRYHFKMRSTILKLFSVQFLLAVVAILLVIFDSNTLQYTVGTIILVSSLYFSYIELNKRVNLKLLIKEHLMRK